MKQPWSHAWQHINSVTVNYLISQHSWQLDKWHENLREKISSNNMRKAHDTFFFLFFLLFFTRPQSVGLLYYICIPKGAHPFQSLVTSPHVHVHHVIFTVNFHVGTQGARRRCISLTPRRICLLAYLNKNMFPGLVTCTCVTVDEWASSIRCHRFSQARWS